MGDKVLQNMGSILKNTFSDDDYLGRIGGDEFCVLVNSRPADNEEFREYIKRKCKEVCDALKQGLSGDTGIDTSASVGAALFPEDGKSFSELYANCDKALYRSKKAGKNTYSLYDDSLNGEGT